MEQSYLVSVSALKEILQPLATEDARYRLINGRDIVTVIHFGPSGLLRQVAFPVAFRIPDVDEDEGTLILMVATERSREWDGFWSPVESRLVSSSTNATA